MPDEKPDADGGTEDRPTDTDGGMSKIDKGARFHEATGGFDEVGKAFLILLIVGIILYVWFLVL